MNAAAVAEHASRTPRPLPGDEGFGAFPTYPVDTKSIISQLMAIERRPQDLLRNRVSELQKTQNAWQQISDKLSALKTASDALAPMRSAASFTTATTSDAAFVGVKAIGAGSNTTAQIGVVTLAAARSDVATDVFSGATDAVGGRTLSLTVNGETTAYTSADGTIGGLVNAINTAKKGVDAKLIQTAPGEYQLGLTSSKSGVSNAFTATTSGWSGWTTVRPAANAVITVDGVTVTRESNTITDVIDGLELSLKQQTTSPIDVSFTRDDAAITEKVKAIVDAANSAMSIVASATKIGTDSASRGPLASDPAARRLSDSIRAVIAAPLGIGGGASLPASSLGVSLTREGTLKFDPAALQKTLSENPEGAIAALGRSGSSTATGVSVSSSTSTATAGARSISITQAATQAGLVSVPSPPPPDGSNINLTVVTPAGTFAVSFTAGSSWGQTATNMTAAMRSLGLRINASATESGGIEDGLQLTEDRYGSAHTFSVSGGSAVGLDGPATAGTDAQGTFDGTAFTAAGRSLATDGLVLSIATTPAQVTSAGGTVTGSVSFSEGLAGALARIGGASSATGVAASSKNAVGERIRDLQTRISRFDDVLSQRESALIRKFANMDTLLSRLNAMSGSFTAASST